MLLTVEDFVARIGEEETLQIAGLGARDYRTVDSARIAAEIEAAAGLIAGYVRARYPAALDAPPEMLKAFCADIARWRLRGKGGQQTAMSETVEKRYEAALAALRDISTGRLILETPGATGDAAEAANAGANARVLGDFPKPRTPEMLEGWR